MLFEDFAHDYLELESKPFKATWKDDARRLRRLEKYFHGKHLEEISTLDVVRMRKALEDRPYEMNRVVDTLHRLYEVAIAWKVYSGDNPADNVRRYREEPRERFVTKDELPMMWAAFEKLEHEYIPAYFKLLILTGLRRNTLRRLEWSHVDIASAVISIPKRLDKNGKSRIVHMSPETIFVFNQIRRKDPFVFWSRAGNQWGDPNGAQLSDTQVGHYWGKVKNITGLDVRIHDLRRTLGSYLAQDGVNQELIGKLLHHSHNSRSTAIYTRFLDQNQREATNQAGRLIWSASRAQQ